MRRVRTNGIGEVAVAVALTVGDRDTAASHGPPLVWFG
jgi:hypothetical protein